MLTPNIFCLKIFKLIYKISNLKKMILCGGVHALYIRTGAVNLHIINQFYSDRPTERSTWI